MMIAPNYFQALLKKIRAQTGLTQEQMAAGFAQRGVRIKSGSISMWETGRSKPEEDKFPYLAELAGLTVSDLQYAKIIVELLEREVDVQALHGWISRELKRAA